MLALCSLPRTNPGDRLQRWLSNNIRNLIETKAVFQFEIEEQRRTVEHLKETTWGVVLHEGEEGRKFVVLPAGSLPNPPWTVQRLEEAVKDLKGASQKTEKIVRQATGSGP